MTYGYDALSRLASSTGSGSVPAAGYVYQGTSSVLAKETVSATQVVSTAFGPLSQKVGTTTSYYLKNPHGDVVGLTQAGASANIAAYDPWGSVVGSAPSGSTGSALGFQGQVTDRATGMTKTDTRFYDPSMGRFTAQDALFGDPMDAGSLNQYAYANGNPVTLNDPTGMAAPQKCAVMGMTWCANHYDEWRAAKLARLRAQDLATSQYSFALGCFCEDRTVPHVFISDSIGTNYLRKQFQSALASTNQSRMNYWGSALTKYTDSGDIVAMSVAAANDSYQASTAFQMGHNGVSSWQGGVAAYNMGYTGCLYVCFGLAHDPNNGWALRGGLGWKAGVTADWHRADPAGGEVHRLSVSGSACAGPCGYLGGGVLMDNEGKFPVRTESAIYMTGLGSLVGDDSGSVGVSLGPNVMTEHYLHF